MAKLRGDEIADLNVKELDEAEWSESDFDSYSGRVPPDNTELYGYVAAMWWCRTAEKDDGSGLDPMIKVLWIAGDNEGELEEYNGLPVVENLVLVAGAKFRWQPFLNVFGITLKAIKTSTYVADEDDERWKGSPIQKIGTFVPGADHDEAWSRLVIKRRYFNENWQAEVKKWLPWEAVDGDGSSQPADDEPEDVDEDATDEPEDEEYDDEPDEDEDEPDEDEPDDEPEPPARGRRAAPARPARAASKPAAATARPARAARAAKPAAAATSSRGRRPAAAASTGRGRKPRRDDPPF